jgi:hypothetical protein
VPDFGIAPLVDAREDDERAAGHVSRNRIDGVPARRK